VQQKSWSDDTVHGLLTPVSKQQCLIIIYAGAENDFVSNVLLMWKSHQSEGNYNHHLNQKNYEKWVREKLVPSLRPNSTVVLDNTPCHNIKINKVLNSNSTKQDMRDLLLQEGIRFSYDVLKLTDRAV
jgi:hypothetical protein